MPVHLEKGAFVCSIDTELAWGYAHLEDDPSTYEHWESYGRVRDTVERLLALMDRYDIRATFAFVGRLLIDHSNQAETSIYPENPQPAAQYFTESRFSEQEFLDRWYAPELIQMVQGAKSEHEIGSHTFSHMIEGEPGYSKSLFEQDLAAAQQHAKSLGLNLKSLIYPKNRVAHVDIAARNGFSCYRSVPVSRTANLPSLPRRVLQKLDAYLPVPPAVSYPVKRDGIWELPATSYYRHTAGWARWQINYVRAAKLKAGIRRAASGKALFHVWFHPYDIASDPKRLLPPLERAFAEVAKLRDAGRLENLTMGEVAESLS